MTPIDRQGMIDALLVDDVQGVTDDFTYIWFLLEHRKPYSQWTDAEIEEAYHGLA
jgi:predicted cupin superfamily sugar epimerase